MAYAVLVSPSDIQVPCIPRIQKALRDHRLDLQCTPEEFRRRHPGTNATLLAIAAGASLDTVYNWGLFNERLRSRQPKKPQPHHCLLLGEASAFLINL